MKVSVLIEDQLKSYEEEKKDYMIYLCEDQVIVANEWIENFKAELPEYLDRDIKSIEFFAEAAYVHLACQ